MYYMLCPIYQRTPAAADVLAFHTMTPHATDLELVYLPSPKINRHWAMCFVFLKYSIGADGPARSRSQY